MTCVCRFVGDNITLEINSFRFIVIVIFKKNVINIGCVFSLLLFSFSANAKIKNTSCLASKHHITQSDQFGDVAIEKNTPLNFKFENGDLYISETTRGSKPYRYGASKYTGYNTYLVNSNMLVNVDSSDIPTKAAIVDTYNINVYWLYCS